MKLMSAVLAALLATPAQAQNPLNLGKGLRTADPSGHVWKDGRMWLYTSHDEECQADFHMKDWYAFSGTKGDQIVFEKLIQACDGQIANHVRLEYPASRKAAFDAIVSHVTKSLRSEKGWQC